MKLSRLMVTAVLIPAAAMSQVAPPSTPLTKAHLDAMESNVARISVAAEKERWNANLSMWKLVFAKSGKLSAGDVQGLQTSLQTIRANVTNVPPSPERERWQANIRLWQAFIRGRAMPAGQPAAAMPCGAQPGTPMPGMPGAMSMQMPNGRVATDAAFGRMKLNVGRIAEPQEKERWSANADLWEAMLAPTP
jgi:hypothetical protein